MRYASIAFAPGTSALKCMLAAENRGGLIASKQVPRLPSSPARFLTSLAASEQDGAAALPPDEAWVQSYGSYAPLLKFTEAAGKRNPPIAIQCERWNVTTDKLSSVKFNRLGSELTCNDLARLMPTNACDTHAHVIGSVAEYPYAVQMKEEPPRSTVENYRAMAKSLGIKRVVFSQPSFYGTDNRCQLDGCAAFGANARFIASVAPDADASMLDSLDASGCRGARLTASLLEPESTSVALAFADRLRALDDRLAGRNWCIEILAPSWLTRAIMPVLLTTRTNYVLCHGGMFLAELGTQQPGFSDLLALGQTGRCWFKLTAPYRWSSAPGYDNTAPLMQELSKAAPDRLLWGSDYPNVFAPADVDDLTSLRLLFNWFPNPEIRDKILVKNPEALFGFSS